MPPATTAWWSWWRSRSINTDSPLPAPITTRALLARRIEATDRQIDRLVYELYGLTEEEIRIVEEANR